MGSATPDHLQPGGAPPLLRCCPGPKLLPWSRPHPQSPHLRPRPHLRAGGSLLLCHLLQPRSIVQQVTHRGRLMHISSDALHLRGARLVQERQPSTKVAQAPDAVESASAKWSAKLANSFHAGCIWGLDHSFDHPAWLSHTPSVLTITSKPNTSKYYLDRAHLLPLERPHSWCEIGPDPRSPGPARRHDPLVLRSADAPEIRLRSGFSTPAVHAGRLATLQGQCVQCMTVRSSPARPPMLGLAP